MYRQARKGANALRAQPLQFVSWNIGGKPVQDALTAIKVVQSLSDTVVCFQELPRTQAGWQTTKVVMSATPSSNSEMTSDNGEAMASCSIRINSSASGGRRTM